jgi:hypothetical protein
MKFVYFETCCNFQMDSYKKKQKFGTSTFWSVVSVYIMSRKSCSEIYISHCESAFFIQWAILRENELCVTQECGLMMTQVKFMWQHNCRLSSPKF